MKRPCSYAPLLQRWAPQLLSPRGGVGAARETVTLKPSLPRPVTMYSGPPGKETVRRLNCSVLLSITLRASMRQRCTRAAVAETSSGTGPDPSHEDTFPSEARSKDIDAAIASLSQ